MCIFNTDCITIQHEQNILITILRVDIYQIFIHICKHTRLLEHFAPIFYLNCEQNKKFLNFKIFKNRMLIEANLKKFDHP